MRRVGVRSTTNVQQKKKEKAVVLLPENNLLDIFCSLGKETHKKSLKPYKEGENFN